jgi:hypothetical protein
MTDHLLLTSVPPPARATSETKGPSGQAYGPLLFMAGPLIGRVGPAAGQPGPGAVPLRGVQDRAA